MEATIEDLEARIDVVLPINLVQEYKLKEGDTEITYVAKFLDISWDKSSTLGKLTITRIDTNPVKRKRFVSFFPPKREEVTEMESKVVWSLGDPCYCRHLISDGKLQKEDYREDLISNANCKGVLLTAKLVDSLLDPIEKKLMNGYQKITQYL